MPRPSRQQRIAEEQAEGRGLRFSPGTKLLVGIYFVIMLAVTYLQERHSGSAFLLGALTGAVAASAILLAIPTYLSWIIFKSRSATDKTCFVVVLILFLALFGQVTSKVRDADNRSPAEQAAHEQAERDYKEATESFSARELRERSLAGEDVSQEIADQINAQADAAERLAEHGTILDRARAVAARVTRDMIQSNREQLAANHEYVTAGAYDPATIADSETLDARLAMLEELIRLSEAARQAYASQESKIRDGLKPLGLTPVQVEQFISGWKRGAQPELADQLNELEIKSYHGQKELLLFLKTNIHDWSVDQAGNVLFQTPLNAERYNQLIDSTDAELEAFEALQEELVDRFENRNRP